MLRCSVCFFCYDQQSIKTKPREKGKSYSEPEQQDTMKGKRPTVFSIASLAFVVLLLTATVYWHGERKQQLPQRTSEFSVQRLLQDVDEEAKGEADNLLDDDQKRSETCKKYLYNFLNGTTDANDQCQGFYNAYQAADCKDDTHNEILGNDQNNTDKDDDVLSEFLFFFFPYKFQTLDCLFSFLSKARLKHLPLLVSQQ